MDPIPRPRPRTKQPTRYKAWRSNGDKQIHVICFEDEFEGLPHKIRSLGPWHGSSEGEIERLKAPYRALLEEQGFVIVYQHLVTFTQMSENGHELT